MFGVSSACHQVNQPIFSNSFFSLLGCVSNRLNPMIVAEYCAHGDLLQFLRKNKGTFLPVRQSFVAIKTGIQDGYVQQPVPGMLTLTIKDLLSFSWQICDGMVDSACWKKQLSSSGLLVIKENNSSWPRCKKHIIDFEANGQGETLEIPTALSRLATLASVEPLTQLFTQHKGAACPSNGWR